MARIAAVFQVWLVATGTTDGDFYYEGNDGYFWSASACGQRLVPLLNGGTLKSVGTTAISDTGFQFVAFGIKNVGLWGA